MATLADRPETDMDDSASRDTNTGARLAELFVAFAVIALGAVILWQSGDIRWEVTGALEKFTESGRHGLASAAIERSWWAYLRS